MIKDLDEAAAPTSTIKVVKLGQGVSGQQAQERYPTSWATAPAKRVNPKLPSRLKRNRATSQQSGNNRNKSSDNSSVQVTWADKRLAMSR